MNILEKLYAYGSRVVLLGLLIVQSAIEPQGLLIMEWAKKLMAQGLKPRPRSSILESGVQQC
ncbi:hypothetical protein AMTR_s00012p00139070 [Amborella trichopoda]|uniref:Uncharacterized protein n=1 Tax=Amborella trichopoda TaxID=13333 RepID=W1PJ71_AMBTC|nr:hypothetical protein AMTR_s00012p00139070 [Amborella trichopoda]